MLAITYNYSNSVYIYIQLYIHILYDGHPSMDILAMTRPKPAHCQSAFQSLAAVFRFVIGGVRLWSRLRLRPGEKQKRKVEQNDTNRGVR
jgi:hypothetical protein